MAPQCRMILFVTTDLQLFSLIFNDTSFKFGKTYSINSTTMPTLEIYGPKFGAVTMASWGLLTKLLNEKYIFQAQNSTRQYDLRDIDFVCQYVGLGSPVDIANIGTFCGLVM